MLGFLFFSFLNIDSCQTRLEPYVVNGEFSNIRDFPHSVCLTVQDDGDTWICGASILNHRILLTAAHCIYSYPTSSMSLKYGSAYLSKAAVVLTRAYKVHPSYSEGHAFGDIGLILTSEPLIFNNNVRRVAILPPDIAPYDEKAFIAGWGRIDESSNIQTDRLKHTKQKIMSRRECIKALDVDIPTGVICGVGEGYAARGDSGCALMVRDYIQVGIVSFKEPHINEAIVVYTDIGFYYNWIREHSLKLFCMS